MITALDYADIVAMSGSPPSIPKEEAQGHPFDYHAFDARSHEAQREAGSFHVLCGDIDTGNPSLETVTNCLDYLLSGSGYLVYSSRSAKAGNLKWRYMLPLTDPIAGDYYREAQEVIFDTLLKVGLQCDQALARPGQLVYLPNRGEHYETHYRDGALDPTKLMATVQRRRG